MLGLQANMTFRPALLCRLGTMISPTGPSCGFSEKCVSFLSTVPRIGGNEYVVFCLKEECWPAREMGSRPSSTLPTRGAGQGPGTLGACRTRSLVAPSQPDVSFMESNHSQGQRRRTGTTPGWLPGQACPLDRPRGLLQGGESAQPGPPRWGCRA